MWNAFKSFFFGTDHSEDLPEGFTHPEHRSEAPNFKLFSNHLNVAAWDDINQLFILDCVDGNKNIPVGVGFVLELNPKLGASDGDMSLIMSSMQALPNHAGVQFITFGRPNVERYLNSFKQAQSQNPNPRLNELFQELAEKRVNFLRKATTETVFSGFPIRVRDYRVIISVVLQDVNVKNKSEIEQAVNVRESIISSLKAAGIYDGAWQPLQLKEWMGEVLNPARLIYGKDRGMTIKYDEDISLRDQVMSPETFMRFANSGNEVQFGFKDNDDAVCMRAYSVSQYPADRPFHLNQMTRLIGDQKQLNLNYPCPFMVVINIHKGNYESERSSIVMSSANAQRRLEQPISKYLPDISQKANDMMMAQKSFTNGGGGLVHILHQVILFDRPDGISSSENAAKAIWRDAGFELMNDLYLQKQSLLASLPMSLDKDFVKGLNSLKRLSTKTFLNAISMSPIMGEWQGVGTPILPLIGANGQAMGFDFFANPQGNYNVAVMGTSGSGKSFTCNEIVRNYIGSGANAYIIDKGRSYEPLCKFVGGQYIEFSNQSNIVLNPFDNVRDISDDRHILKLMLGTMCAPINGISEYQASVLDKIIIDLWERKAHEATIDDVAYSLTHFVNEKGDSDPDINRLGTQIFPFTSAGVYGKWFMGKSNLNFENEFVVLDTDDLSNKPDLRKVIVQFAIYQITQHMYESRDKRGVVVIDEAWDILDGGENEAKFINEGFRKVRKYDGAFITATQNAKDYSLSKAAMAALQNADWIIALRGKEESVIELGEKLSLNEFQKSQIRGLNTITGVYAEMYVHCPIGSGVGRLIVDPFNQLMGSTRPQDFNDIQTKLAQGLNIREALEAVLDDRGIVH